MVHAHCSQVLLTSTAFKGPSEGILEVFAALKFILLEVLPGNDPKAVVVRQGACYVGSELLLIKSNKGRGAT